MAPGGMTLLAESCVDALACHRRFVSAQNLGLFAWLVRRTCGLAHGKEPQCPAFLEMAVHGQLINSGHNMTEVMGSSGLNCCGSSQWQWVCNVNCSLLGSQNLEAVLWTIKAPMPCYLKAPFRRKVYAA
eukprot:3867630-Amphidinium_carterae.2